MTKTQHATDSCKRSDVPVPTQDVNFENACIDLLSKQENMLAQLGETNRKFRTIEALEFAKQMLVAFLDFAESRFNDDEFSSVTKRIHEVYLHTKELEKEAHQQSWNGLKRLLGLKCGSVFDTTRKYQDLCADYAALYADFFAICIKRFESDEAQQKDLLQSVDVFLAELKGKW